MGKDSFDYLVKDTNYLINSRFLESDDYVGVIDDEDVLTMPVKPNGVLRLWCGAVSTPPPKISWSLEGEGELKAYANEHMLTVSPFTPANEVSYW